MILDEGVSLAKFSLGPRTMRVRFVETWQAYDRELKRQVTLKIFNADLCPVEQRLAAAQRFWESARKMATLDREAHCTTIIDGPEIEAGWLWFATDSFAQSNLETAIENGALDTTAKKRVFQDLLEAVRQAHSENIIHGDIRPKNVLIAERSRVHRGYLTDFDIAFYEGIPETTDDRDWQDAKRYYPPQVVDRLAASGNSVDARRSILSDRRADIHALCVVLLELFSERGASLPASSNRSAFHKHFAGYDIDPETEARVVGVCARGLGPPLKQFRTAEELNQSWQRGERDVVASITAGLVIVGIAFALLLIGDWCYSILAVSRGRWLAIALKAFGLVIALLGGGAALVGWLKATVATGYTRATSIAARTQPYSWVGAFVVLLVGAILPKATHLGTRLTSYYVRPLKNCKFVTESGDAHEAKYAPQNEPDAFYISCTQDPASPVERSITGASLFSLDLKLVEYKPGEAEKNAATAAAAAPAPSPAAASASAAPPAVSSVAALRPGSGGGVAHAPAHAPKPPAAADARPAVAGPVMAPPPSPPSPVDPKGSCVASCELKAAECLRVCEQSYTQGSPKYDGCQGFCRQKIESPCKEHC
jgi:hypothetical protein